MNLPDGLHLGVNEEGMLGILSGGVTWVTFEDGGEGDPHEWAANIVLATCRALGVSRAIDFNGNIFDVETFASTYITEDHA